ncbi:MAG: hypothetical protein M1305_02385, partial [Candidatus Marsarchaeota archaeon]|nr:hypothetical protein [Candidatus Marsarchaeota archaeon]
SQICLENRGVLDHNPFAIKENLFFEDVPTAVEEVSRFKKRGGNAIAEVTPIGQGRDPEGLRRVSEQTGLNIIMSTGFYIQAGHPAYVAEKSIDDLAAIMIKEITDGVDGTGIRAGVMGDVGTTKSITEDERKVLRACARAHLATGAAIGVHIDPSSQEALRAVKILLDEGVRPGRIIMEHMDEVPDSDYHLAVAATGVFLEFGAWGEEVYYEAPWFIHEPTDVQRAQCAKVLVDRGYTEQILIGQDVWLKQFLHKYGGDGYDCFLTYGAPLLKHLGLSDRQINTLLIDNPKRALSLGL